MGMYPIQPARDARGRGRWRSTRLACVTPASAAHPLDYLDTADDVDVFLASIKGTTDWRRYDVVIDVAADATQIMIGLLLDGKGSLWLDEPSFEIVGQDVPLTALGMPRSPQNLGFES